MRKRSSIAPQDRILSEEEGIRRSAACHSFWSDHPLNLAFRAERQADGFTLKDFAGFVIAMPAARFDELTGGRNAD
jgi:hypothetical protein